MKFLYIFSLLVILTARSMSAEASCPSMQICPQFKNDLDTCSKNRKSKICDRFVEDFRKLTPRYECKRSFDTKPVPAVWLCDVGSTPGLHERAVALLSKLKLKKAQLFFASDELRSTLDGEVAEEFMDKSTALSKRLKR